MALMWGHVPHVILVRVHGTFGRHHVKRGNADIAQLMERCGPRIAGLLDLSADPLKRVLQDEPSDRLAERLTGVGRRPEVNACEDARVSYFLERRREVPKRARNAEHQVGLHAEIDAVLELMCQYGACRRTVA